MALVHHPDIELMQGDDWVIPFTLLDVNGAPLNLTIETNIEWALINPNGMGVITQDDIEITVNDPATGGTGSIAVPSALTENFAAGRYFDSLRATINTVSTLWVGNILVDADPFSV